MVEKHIGGSESKEIFYAELEQFAREKIRGHLQDLLEQEVSEWLGREKSERKVNADEQPGYRNGYGRTRVDDEYRDHRGAEAAGARFERAI